MATMYCALCGRPVEARRQIGLGTVVLAAVTLGLSLAAIPFYRKRCSICKSSAVSLLPPGAAPLRAGESLVSTVAELEHRLKLVEEELGSAGVELARLKQERDFYSQLLQNPVSRRESGNK